MQQPAAVPTHPTSSSRPATAREAAMDLIDLANVKVFGNRHFRPKQREIIKAALQVTCAFQPASPTCACAWLSVPLSFKSAFGHRPDETAPTWYLAHIDVFPVTAETRLLCVDADWWGQESMLSGEAERLSCASTASSTATGLPAVKFGMHIWALHFP